MLFVRRVARVKRGGWLGRRVSPADAPLAFSKPPWCCIGMTGLRYVRDVMRTAGQRRRRPPTTCRFAAKGKTIRYFVVPTPRGTGDAAHAPPADSDRAGSIVGRLRSTNENSRPRDVESRRRSTPPAVGRPNNDASRNVLFLGSPSPRVLKRAAGQRGDARHGGVARTDVRFGNERSPRAVQCSVNGQGG